MINLLVGSSATRTGAEPGLTKRLQKLRLSENIFIFDTPGVIPSKEYTYTDSRLLTKHFKVGARAYDRVKDPEQVVAGIMKEFPWVLEKRYGVESNGDSEILLENLGKKRNFLKKGGVVDSGRAARFILKEWQEGKIRHK